jgi:hypothetical protein
LVPDRATSDMTRYPIPRGLRGSLVDAFQQGYASGGSVPEGVPEAYHGTRDRLASNTLECAV